jgi:hypothetical protein
MPFQKLRSSRVAKPNIHIKRLAGWRRGYQCSVVAIASRSEATPNLRWISLQRAKTAFLFSGYSNPKRSHSSLLTALIDSLASRR